MPNSSSTYQIKTGDNLKFKKNYGMLVQKILQLPSPFC